jgi:branched-chain amino acid aminotransferase
LGTRELTPADDVVADSGAAGLSTVWINGQRQSSADGPHLSARDRGLTLADGLFETMRGNAGRVFRLDRHLARLERGLAALAIGPVPQIGDWVRAAARSVPGDISVRVTVTRGNGRGGLAPLAGADPTAIVLVGAMPIFPPIIYETGLTVHIASGRLNERSMTAGLKTLSYTDSVAAFLEARRAGADESLLLDTEGHCGEATASNLFVWTRGALLTPPLTCGVLPGITRATVIELARAADIQTVERAFGLDELLSADEAFLTSSLRGLAPIVRVGTHPIGNGTPGAYTHRLRAAYEALVAEETG